MLSRRAILQGIGATAVFAVAAPSTIGEPIYFAPYCEGRLMLSSKEALAYSFAQMKEIYAANVLGGTTKDLDDAVRL